MPMGKTLRLGGLETIVFWCGWSRFSCASPSLGYVDGYQIRWWVWTGYFAAWTAVNSLVRSWIDWPVGLYSVWDHPDSPKVRILGTFYMYSRRN